MPILSDYTKIKFYNIDPSDEEQKDFVSMFRASLFEGQKRYQRIDPVSIPLQGPGYYRDDALFGMNTRVESGVAIEMAQSDFSRLMRYALEGAKHARFREQHPSAQAMYDQYNTMYHLST